MQQSLNFYDFGLWVFDCLDMTKPKMQMSDVIEIVEYINPDTYEQLAEMILKNSLDNIDDYQKNKNVFDDIIKYMISSFEKRDMNLFNEKCKLIEFVIERKN